MTSAKQLNGDLHLWHFEFLRCSSLMPSACLKMCSCPYAMVPPGRNCKLDLELVVAFAQGRSEQRTRSFRESRNIFMKSGL